MALRGPRRIGRFISGATRPWVIQSVHLFDAQLLLVELHVRVVNIRMGSSVRRALWAAAEIYLEPRNATFVLSQEQWDLLALFGPGPPP